MIMLNICNSQRNYVKIYQSDFEEGPFIIDEPGYYLLAEDITFDPP